MAPTRSTHPAVGAASRSDPRWLAGWSWASATARADGSDEGIVALWSGRSGAARAGSGSGFWARRELWVDEHELWADGPRSREPRREGASRRLASSAPTGSIDAREEEAGMRTVRPRPSSSRRRVSPSVEFLDVSAKCRPLQEGFGGSKRCTDAVR
jgi:hypothetical protein